MKMLSLMWMLLSMHFMFMKHLLSMGFILLMETIFSSLTCNLNLNSYLHRMQVNIRWLCKMLLN